MTKAELIARLEGLEGADREGDCLIHEWLDNRFKPVMRGTYYGEYTGEYFAPDGGYFGKAPAYTASLDAALALVREKLPGWFWTVRSPWDDETAFTAVLASSDYRDESWEAGDQVTTDILSGVLVSAKAPSPAIAVLIALLKALPEGEAK